MPPRLIEPVTSLYDGHCRLGDVLPRGDQFEAVLASGRSLGRYNTPHAAARAISAETHRDPTWAT